MNVIKKCNICAQGEECDERKLLSDEILVLNAYTVNRNLTAKNCHSHEILPIILQSLTIAVFFIKNATIELNKQ